MEPTFTLIETKSYDSSYFKCHEDIEIFIWEGEDTVARLIKTTTTYPEVKNREFPKFWKTYKYQRNKDVSYYLAVRTKEESKENNGVDIFANNDEEAIKKAFIWLRQRVFY
jgi:hypothetical protein